MLWPSCLAYVVVLERLVDKDVRQDAELDGPLF